MLPSFLNGPLKYILGFDYYSYKHNKYFKNMVCELVVSYLGISEFSIRDIMFFFVFQLKPQCSCFMGTLCSLEPLLTN